MCAVFDGAAAGLASRAASGVELDELEALEYPVCRGRNRPDATRINRISLNHPAAPGIGLQSFGLCVTSGRSGQSSTLEAQVRSPAIAHLPLLQLLWCRIPRQVWDAKSTLAEGCIASR